ncbi:MAG: hypothetical protein NDJ94_20165 [Vicinamibacteria bacterium]|nr:hypothetical protein [Vicinamibacteria bacterium]
MSVSPTPARSLDEVLADRLWLDGPRAALLLRVCQAAQVLRPEVFERYWGELKKISPALPVAQHEVFVGLKSAIEPVPPAELKGWRHEVADAIAAALALAQRHPAAGRDALAECEARITSHWWWPFGRGPLWLKLVLAWLEVDRGEGLSRLGRLDDAVARNLLESLNDQKPLTVAEWNAVYDSRVADVAQAAVAELLDRGAPQFAFDAARFADVGRRLREEILPASIAKDDREAEAKADKALDRYLHLVRLAQQLGPEPAQQLREALLLETAGAKRYDENWTQRFSALFRLLAVWAAHEASRDSTRAFLETRMPELVRGAVLAHWCALLTEGELDASAKWQQIEPLCTDASAAETWFLVVLLRRGQADVAFQLARRSPRAEAILPSLHRAWLFEHPAAAPTPYPAGFSADEVADDVIAQFMLCGTPALRAEFLRERTARGSQPPPPELWSRPGIDDMLAILNPDKPGARDPRRFAAPAWYSRLEAKEKQFATFVRQNGYGQYTQENVDPHLLAALVAWDEAYPAEAEQALAAMWEVMKPGDTGDLRQDLIRNAIFERCQECLAARVDALDRFARWVKAELVDQTVSETVGNTTYSFSLNEKAPFLYLLLGAEKVARLSAARRDALIAKAIADYKASPELMTATARLYASDKGFAALQPPAPLLDRSLEEAWQLGVGDAARPAMLASLVRVDESTVREDVAALARA